MKCVSFKCRCLLITPTTYLVLDFISHFNKSNLMINFPFQTLQRRNIYTVLWNMIFGLIDLSQLSGKVSVGVKSKLAYFIVIL